jgi:hypothetical protein
VDVLTLLICTRHWVYVRNYFELKLSSLGLIQHPQNCFRTIVSCETSLLKIIASGYWIKDCAISPRAISSSIDKRRLGARTLYFGVSDVSLIPGKNSLAP